MKTWLVALLVALQPCVAGAAGLGRLNVLSALGQPLIAEIELVSVTREELGSLSARLAHPDTYRLANLQYSPALTGARLTIERRPNGQHYIKLISTRPVTEPFIDLLVELNWAAGRLAREYTALLDPPGMASAVPAPVISAAPESRPAPEAQPQQPQVEPQPQVQAQTETQPQVAAAPAASGPITPAVPMAGGKDYGPIQRGETLGKIAKSVMPEGVTLEQMLVALYRSNPDAFIRKNLNLVRTGKMLRVPDREEVASIARGEAVKEYRTHVADWNTYRQKVADAAGTVPTEGRTAVSGKITTKVEEKAGGGAPKDVVRLSKGEAPGAAKSKPGSPADRTRMQEEDAVARQQALKEANERNAQLEKIVKDKQKLAELTSPGMATAQQQAQQTTKSKPEPKAVAKPEAAPPVAAKPEEKKVEQAATPAPKKDETAAQPKPKPAATPKPKEPELIDQILEAATDPLYLGVGGGVIVLGGLAFFVARRRRSRGDDDESPGSRRDQAAAAAAGAAATTPDATAATEPAAAATDDVDPLAEAEVYIAYGRDGQAEEILKEALSKDSKREDVQLKLLEIYSARKDKSAFGKLAGDLNKLTGGSGDNWIKAAAMGYALDPANSLYAAGKDAVIATASTAGAGDVDLDLGLGDTGTATDITLDAGAAAAGAEIVDLGAGEKTGMPDFTLEVPAAGGAPTDVALDVAPPAQDAGGMLDFKIELPNASENTVTAKATPAAAAPSLDAGLDFKLDDLDLGLEGASKSGAAAGGEKDGHWHDVQTKFDLAKAYQEMGDKDGAKEILKEVIKEGDADQRTQAKTLMDSLG
ncbi:MAG TPA: FimV/HubP family polar landmark protein [Burkholderiales bacterium]|nr:FimV/HubP family polar landmark protein [Burkholderiales bacterium]